MKLNKKDNLELNTDTSPREKSKSKSDLGNILSKSKESELIEKEYEALTKNIESIITHNFLRKDFYANLPDGTNPEIDNICNHSALDLENRVKK